jgi:hypothetical protein
MAITAAFSQFMMRIRRKKQCGKISNTFSLPRKGTYLNLVIKGTSSTRKKLRTSYWHNRNNTVRILQESARVKGIKM